jgi:cysteine desulfurase/selenocysteine lyase
LQLYGDLDVETRGGIVAFDKRDVAPKMLADKLASEGIVIEAGNFAAPRVLKTFNRDKWARVCVHYFNDNEDIDRFITGLERVK